jgi:thiol-disulfide isomerase/thioredoxin
VAVLVAAVAAGSLWLSQRTSPADVARAAGAPAGDGGALEIVAPGPAPSIEGAAGWLNTAPLDDSSLAGKVVLYEFWTFGCRNCRNALPHVRALYDRYAADGLVVLSIHTPEFGYEAERDNVARFVEEQEIHFPVALDPDRTIWREWRNRYWPNFFLYDQAGRLRQTHVGEGGYAEREDAVRGLLGVDPSSPRVEPLDGG